MSDTTDAQRWVMAVGAPLNRRNSRRLDRLGGDGRPTISWEASSVLRNGWNVQTADDASRAVTWLLGGGHRAQYEASGHGPARTFGAWDASRASNVAGWAYAAYLVDLTTAWQWQLRAAALAQETSASWAELGQSYLRGLDLWSEGDRKVLDPSEQAVAWLSSDAASPWLTLPFDLDVRDVPAPQLEQTLVTVGQGDALTIADAIRIAGPDGRVVLPAGTYRESISLPHSIELVADGAVTLESTHVPTVKVEKTLGVLLRGIAVRAQTTETGASLNAVRVNRAYARIEACDVQATHDGVQIATFGAAHVVDSTIRGCGSMGLNLIGGQLIAERCEIAGIAKEAIRAGGEGVLVVENCTLTENGSNGVLVHEKVRARVRRTTLADNGGSASIVAIGQSDIVVEDTSIARSRGGGVFFQETAGGVIARTKITASKLAGLDVGSQTPVQAIELTIADHPSAGVLVRGSARLVLSRSELIASGEGHVWVMSGGSAAIAGCRFTTGAQALWVQNLGAAYVHDTVLEKQSGVAVDVQPEASVALSLVTIVAPAGDGVLVGEGAELSMVLCGVEDAAGAGVRVTPGGRVTLEAVRLERCVGGDVVGDATREPLVGGEEERAKAAHAALRQFIDTKIG